MTQEEDRDIPTKATPKVRASVVEKKEDSPAPKKRRATPKVKANKETSPSKFNPRTLLLMLASLLVGIVGTYAVTSPGQEIVAETPTAKFTEVISGKVALDEDQLKSAVKQLGVDVYWAGPVADAKYTLSVPETGKAYVRYLPNGQGIDDTNPYYVVIATYTADDAFNATQAAGNQTNGVSFINPDGAAVYYSKETPTNVYVAYPNLNYQIEIFNPMAQTALDIASKPGALRLVK
jgi:hypothetical protein